MSNQGTVKWFNSRKGFGFIVPEGNGEDGALNNIFVHFSSIVIEDESRYKTLYENDKVSFNIVESEKGREARDVIITERAPRIKRKKSSKKSSKKIKSSPRAPVGS